jgi:hypothetical protein
MIRPGSGRQSSAGNVAVEAYAGYKGEETPRAFVYASRRYEISSILEHWYTDRYSCFRVAANDGHRYVLRHDTEEFFWELVMREDETIRS